MHTFDATTPAGRPLLSVDFSRLLPPSVTIASAIVTVEVHALSPVDDPNATDRLDGAAIVSVDSTTISQWFHQGLEDVDYVLTFTANFSDGQVEPVEAELRVRRFI
jgi:hypothetical protein